VEEHRIPPEPKPKQRLEENVGSNKTSRVFKSTDRCLIGQRSIEPSSSKLTQVCRGRFPESVAQKAIPRLQFKLEFGRFAQIFKRPDVLKFCDGGFSLVIAFICLCYARFVAGGVRCGNRINDVSSEDIELVEKRVVFVK